MRVTDRMIFENAIRNSGQARARAEAATEEVSTGRKVQHPWDDPAAAGQLVQHRLQQATWRAVETNAARASDELNAADGAMDGVSNLLVRARELAVQLANGSYSAQERTQGAAEVQGLVQDMTALLNTRVGNRYLFGGTADGSPPFDVAGTFLGSATPRRVEVAPGVPVVSSLQADVAIKGVGGGVDVYATLQSLQAAMAANDVPGIQATLDNLSSATSQVAGQRSSGGSTMTLLDAGASAARVAHDHALAAGAALSDADVIDAAGKLALSQRALEAALTASKQSFSQTMLDILK